MINLPFTMYDERALGRGKCKKVIVCYNKEKKIVHLKLYIVNGK